ncbi:ribosomal protein L21-like protein [Xylariaceae sp. FL0804]|nr:ribosomal protein L21-like protein [Xylariaceae sp. FL0804]
MSRSLLRSALELRTPVTRLPPSYLLPLRARRLITSTTQHVDPAAGPPTTSSSTATHAPTTLSRTVPSSSPSTHPPSPLSTRPPPPSRQHPLASHARPTPAPGSASAASASVMQLLPLLRAQPGPHYATVHVHGRPYLVTAGDRVRLPFRMAGVAPGDVLRLTCASALGSRDYTLRGAPWVDEGLFACRAVVEGVATEPMRVKVKTKRRQRRARRVMSKHKYTLLRVCELEVRDPADAADEEAPAAAAAAAAAP